MKRIFLMAIVVLLFAQSCKKEAIDLIDGQRPEDRIAASVENLDKILTGSANGWVAYLQTTVQGGGYNFYLAFDDKNKVKMSADYSATTALNIKESTYRIKQVMATSLLFDTYNYLHDLQNPDPAVFGGVLAEGFGSDIEFEFIESKGDTLKFIGKKRDVNFILIKATAADKDYYTTDKFSKTITGINAFLASSSFFFIEDPSDKTKKIEFSMRPAVVLRTLGFTSVSAANGKVLQYGDLFSFSKDGARLVEPIVVAGKIFTHLFFDITTNKLFGVTPTSEKIEILKSSSPIFPLNVVIGSTLKGISVPNGTNVQGWGTDFITRRATSKTRIDALGLQVSGFALTLGAINFNFDAENNAMTLNIGLNAFSTIPVIDLPYPYTYTKTSSGVFKFTAVEITNGDSKFVHNSANRPLDPLLADRLNKDTFTLDYFVDSSGKVQGLIKSVENPTFILVGDLN